MSATARENLKAVLTLFSSPSSSTSMFNVAGGIEPTKLKNRPIKNTCSITAVDYWDADLIFNNGLAGCFPFIDPAMEVINFIEAQIFKDVSGFFAPASGGTIDEHSF